MKSTFLFAVIVVTILVGGCAKKGSVPVGAAPALDLSPLFDNGAVLQRGQPLPVWGQDKPGQVVTVSLNAMSASATANEEGYWIVRLPSMKAGGPYDMTVRGSSVRVFRNVMVGEVWICSGQSNMEWPLENTWRPVAQATELLDERLRLFKVQRIGSTTPKGKVRGYWSPATIREMQRFSAVALHFGKQIAETQDVAVGLIQCAWGGSRAETWIPAEVVSANNETRSYVERLEKELSVSENKRLRKKYEQQFRDALRNSFEHGSKNTGTDGGWHKAQYDDSEWQPMDMPARWESHGVEFDGKAWLRRTIHLPEDWEGVPVSVSLGMVDDHDETWFNGLKIGETDISSPAAHLARRMYEAPGAVVKAGRNTISIRVTDFYAAGGLHGPDHLFYLARLDGKGQPIDLTGEWRFRKERQMLLERPSFPSAPEFERQAVIMPGAAWNGMIEPLIPYGIRGVLWYHGEAHVSEPVRYRTLLRMIMETWRERWGNGDFPFLIVQIAPFGHFANPFRAHSAEFRESQEFVAASLPHAEVIVITDAGNCHDIHPADKRTVGERLASAARDTVYGDVTDWRPPRPNDIRFGEGAAVVEYRNSEGGLDTPSLFPNGFLIAGNDRIFYPARMEVFGDNVIVVSHPEVPRPVALRYNWSDCPSYNIFNAAGIPAAPFRTDDWDRNVTMVEVDPLAGEQVP